MDDASQAVPVTKRIKRFLEVAYQESLKVEGNHRLGAVLVRGGKIISKGRNNYCNQMHAEVSTLGRAWKSERVGCDLFVVRCRKNQRFGMSKPCPNCTAFIKDSGVKRVFFTDNDSNVRCYFVR